MRARRRTKRASRDRASENAVDARSQHDGPYARLVDLQQTIGNQATAQLLQRAFTTAPGPEAPNRNVLKELARGSSQLGYTFPVLNGARVHSKSEIYTKLNAPEVDVTPAGAGTFRGAVNSVGANVGSYDLEYVNPGQKSGEQALTRGELASSVEGLRKIMGGLPIISDKDVADLRRDSGEKATLAIKADFSELAKQTLEHERRHGSDHLAVFKEIMGKWDRTLERARGAGQRPRVQANDADAATDQLWTLVGGDPVDVSARVWTEMVRRSDAFHSTPEGAEARVSEIAWTKDAAHLAFELDVVPQGQGDVSLTSPIKSVKDKAIIEIVT